MLALVGMGLQVGFVATAAAVVALAAHRAHPWAPSLGAATVAGSVVHLVGMCVASTTLATLWTRLPHGGGATALANGLEVAWVVHVIGAAWWMGTAALTVTAWRAPGLARTP